MKTPTTRNPIGIVKRKPIALRLTADELAEAERAAKVTGCSKSLLGRKAFLLGLPLLLAQEVLPTSTGLCGGSAKTEPAAFSSNKA